MEMEKRTLSTTGNKPEDVAMATKFKGYLLKEKENRGLYV
jgi:hypothetical protein